MTRYLEFHEWPDWAEPEPLKHHVHIHDFAMIMSHDVPCYVCWDGKAVVTSDMTPGQFAQSWQPCRTCQAAGWLLVQKPPSRWQRLVALWRRFRGRNR